MKQSKIHRREFVQGCVATVCSLAAPSIIAAPIGTSLKAAVIGATGRGDYGHGLDGIFNGRKNIEVVAVADPDAAGRRAAAEKIHAPRSYASYREMLARETPNLVSVAMRQADQHREIITACLRAGAHVYSEKPFVTAPDEADEVLTLAQKGNLKVAVAHTMRMMPIVTRLKQGVKEGLIGDLVEMRAYGKQDSRAGGEDMMVLGSHLFDLMRLFAGDPVTCTARVMQKGRAITAQDRQTVKDNNGVLAGTEVFAQFSFLKSVSATFTSTEKLRETVGHWGIEFFGSKGVARLNCDVAPNVFLRRTTGWSAKGKTDNWEPLDLKLIQTPPEHNLGPVGDWLEAIASNREPECSGRNGAWAVEMVCGVYQAALEEKEIRFPLKNRKHPLA
ncbi:MAG TPA: Gfo/Idh/MocA family oxidoreductase [Candidatus Saccharimonadales bacterium]|nr:Gfo/Idh/MocA family oxidoreductase [Candidatus Saccharimonadales bacterium]